MLSLEEATKIAQEGYPNSTIQSVIDYRQVWLFQIFTDDPMEGMWAPFFSVDKKTGEFRDFSVMDDGNIFEISALFLEKQNSK
jgi:hypothetical protein